MKLWSDFFDLLSPDLPNCPQAAQVLALREAAIAFCEQSLAWKYRNTDIPVEIGTADYPFDPPVGAVVYAVTYAEFNDVEIEVNTAQDDMRIWNWRHQTGTPQYVLGSPTVLTLVPTPNVAGTLKVDVALKPSPTSEGIDDDIFNEYREAIVHWAAARLMLSPNKPYTNPNMATYHMQQFFSLTGAAGLRAARNYTRAPFQTSIMRRR
jgi:hypothetical protein